jgi:hypothetical protein
MGQTSPRSNMNSNSNKQTVSTESETIEVDLREPLLAAALAWLCPGAGHLYQRRYRKGALFMICILGTFFFGLILGNGHVVYASWRPNDYRWQAIPQLGMGLPAFPAVIQNLKVRDGGDPYMVTAWRFPRGHRKAFQIMSSEERERYAEDMKKNEFMAKPLMDGFMAPPDGELSTNDADVLAMWTAETQHGFELGTLYTVVAGLLNILAIYDAFAGPVLPSEDEKKNKEDESDESSSGNS